MKMPKLNMVEIATEVGGLTLGASAASFVQHKLVKMLPESMKKYEKWAAPVIPIVGGVLLRRYAKKGFLFELGGGLIAGGGSMLVVEHLPGMAGLSEHDLSGIGDKVDDILKNMLNDDNTATEDKKVVYREYNPDPEGEDLGDIEDELGEMQDEVGDDGLHSDLGDDGLHNDMGDDGLHEVEDEVGEEIYEELAEGEY